MIVAERESQRRTKAVLVAALERAGTVVRGTACCCPFCPDTHPSGSVHQDADGAWRFTCHRPGCGFSGDVFDVRARSEGRPLAEVLPRSDGADQPFHVKAQRDAARPRIYPTLDALAGDIPHAVATYRYTDPDTGVIELAVVRSEPPGERKRFCQCRPEGGGWVKKKPDGRQPIYNRTRVRAARIVVVVEGEKAVHALTEVLPPDVAATTAPGGSSKGRAEEADWSPLAGKTVYLWPDCDPPGEGGIRAGLDHMTRVAGELDRLTPRPEVRWIDPDGLGLPPKGDAVEFLSKVADLPACQRQDAIDAVLRSARPLCPSGDLHQLLLDTIEGRREAVPWPWPNLQQQTRALLPGTLTALCGGEGASKSFMAVACCWHWLDQGRKVAYLALERERAFHLLRLLAHLEGRWDLMDDEWQRANPRVVLDTYAAHRGALDCFAPCITAPHCEQFSRRDAVEWLKRQCADGCRIAVIDPVTALMDSGDLWTNDLRFVMDLRAVATPAGCSIILVTHPRTGGVARGLSPLEAVAGGAAYRRFTDTVLWLQKPKRAQDSQVAVAGGRRFVTHNRILHLLKTRDGVGQGRDVAFDFGRAGPSFAELGVIVGDGEG